MPPTLLRCDSPCAPERLLRPGAASVELMILAVSAWPLARSMRSARPMEPSKRTAVLRPAALPLALLLSLPGRSWAQAVPVPVELQATLLSRVAAYDRSFRARAGDTARVLILVKPKSAESVKVGRAMAAELGPKRIAALPVSASLFPLTTPGAVADACRVERIAIVYLTPGLGDEIEGIGRALAGVDVLSVASVASYVGSGAVLGFDAASGKPQMLVDLARASAQNVKLTADVLRLMKVIP